MNYLYQHPWLFSGVITSCIGLMISFFILLMFSIFYMFENHPKIAAFLGLSIVAVIILVVARYALVESIIIQSHQTLSQ
jgi:uncharacterized membrane protein